MDDRRFDRLARAVAGTTTRRGALAAVAGLAAGMPALASAPRKDRAGKRRRCRSGSPQGQCCRRRDEVVTCTCLDGGTICGGHCCTAVQTCRDGACVEATVGPSCLALQQSCEDEGIPCCDGLVCGSIQSGGKRPRCLAPAGAACASDDACVFGTTCIAAVCTPPPGPTATPEPTATPTPEPTATAVPTIPTGSLCGPGDRCTDPAASCTTYISWASSSTDTRCLLPFDATCAVAADCRCKACTSGTCREVCDVCATCTHTTVQSAVNAASASGGVVKIAAGTYPATIVTITNKTLTLRPCNTLGRPVLTAAANAGDTAVVITAEVTTAPTQSVTIDSLTILGGAHPVKAIGPSTAPDMLSLSIRNSEMSCATTQRTLDLSTGRVFTDISDSVLTCVTVASLSSGNTPKNRLTMQRTKIDGGGNPSAAGLGVDVSGSDVTLEDVEITRCAGWWGGGFKSFMNNVIAFKGQTKIWRNQAGGGGGGALFMAGDGITIESTVRIVENRAPAGSGAGIRLENGVSVTGVTTTTVSGNYDGSTTTVTATNQCVNGSTGQSCMTPS